MTMRLIEVTITQSYMGSLYVPQYAKIGGIGRRITQTDVTTGTPGKDDRRSDEQLQQYLDTVTGINYAQMTTKRMDQQFAIVAVSNRK